MATTNLVIVALVALSALQVLGHRIQSVNDDVDDAMKKALKVLQEISDIVHTSVNSGRDYVNSTIEKVDSKQATVDKYTANLASIEERVTTLHLSMDPDNFDDIDINPPVLQCFQGVRAALIDVEISNINTQYDCSDLKIKTVRQTALQMLDNLDDMDREIVDATNVLMECKQYSDSTDSIDCINKAVDNLNRIGVRVPENIQDANDKIDRKLKKLEVRVQQCSDDIIPNFAKDIEDLSMSFLKCMGA